MRFLPALLLLGGLSLPVCGDIETAPNVKLAHFAQVDEGVYKGAKPKSDADFRFLESLHIKYIVDLQVVPLHRSEENKAARYGIQVIPVRMNASPISPSEKHVAKVLGLLRDPQHRPIYFHCALGRDRTALIAALYKMYFMGMSQQEAKQYLRDSGYKYGWVRSGLTRYLDKHPTPPAALVAHP